MDCIEFKNVSFSYEESETDVFRSLTMQLPGGITTLVGQNGTGKSTFLMLAGGRLLPVSGTVYINGTDTRDFKDEEIRNKLASIIYQNMEFETDENIGELLEYVYYQGNLNNPGFIEEIIDEFDLKETLGKKFQTNSKGDMQKISIAFSLLYGSPYILMDEPVFALEHKWKERVLAYLKDYTHRNGVSLYYSVHEIDLSRKYSDNALLFNKDGSIILGPADHALKDDLLEEAYQVPMELLHKRESIFRRTLENPIDLQALSGKSVKVIE